MSPVQRRCDRSNTQLPRLLTTCTCLREKAECRDGLSEDALASAGLRPLHTHTVVQRVHTSWTGCQIMHSVSLRINECSPETTHFHHGGEQRGRGGCCLACPFGAEMGRRHLGYSFGFIAWELKVLFSLEGGN